MAEKPVHMAVRAIVHDEHGRCLLIRRSSACKHFVGTWEWPGGKADPGERVDEALRREVREETGLEIQLDGVAGAYGIRLQEADLSVLCIEARPGGGKLQLSEEHDQAAWVLPSDWSGWNITQGLRQFALDYASRTRPIPPPGSAGGPAPGEGPGTLPEAEAAGVMVHMIDASAYKPKPLDTSAVWLPPDLVQLTEQLAEHAHDIWAQQRLADGWTYGPKRDDAAKKHPCLVPYGQLPDSEKTYDRQMATGTLKAILALGYRILR